MTPADQDLLDLADSAGIRIEYATLHPDRDGEYVHAQNLIRLRPGMSTRLARSVLAHELGHAAFADVPSRFGPVNAKQERRADEWAALRLISHDDYVRAEVLHDGHAGAIAVELGVVRSIVDAYRRVLLRVDGIVYEKPGMGAGNWTEKYEIA